MTNAFNALQLGEIRGVTVGFLRAYAINDKATTGFLNDSINNTEESNGIKEFFIRTLNMVELLGNEMSDMCKEDRIEFVEQSIENLPHVNNCNMDFSQIHYNPTQGRKLDL